MTEVGLQGPRVVPLVGQRITAGVPEHVRVRLEGELRLDPYPLNHAGKAGRGEWRATLGREHERRLRVLLPLQPAQRTQLIALIGWVAGLALFDATDGQGGTIEVDLVPAQVHQLGHA